jgi:U3 small nucleolar RNA-associated protein 19
VFCFFLKAFSDVIGKQSNEQPSDTYLQNVFNVLEQLTLAKKTWAANPENPKLVLRSRKEDEKYLETLNQHSKLFDKVWFEFISWKLSPSFHRKVLIFLPEKLFPHCDNPVFFTDFFMRSYNFGGPVSLLSLNGLYILMQKYNLEYPDFYQKLYNILEPSVFHAKYKARFFYLIDMFLKSTHLPQYLVAAFIKRLSRLSLAAPANCVVLTTPLIMNLLSRHPNLLKIIHNPNPVDDLSSDPYDMSEPDPAKCRAEESSLWELKILQRHYCPMVGHAAMFIGNPLPSTEMDITDKLEMTTAEMMKKESNLNVKEIPLNFDRPRGLFLRKEDRMSQFWAVE